MKTKFNLFIAVTLAWLFVAGCNSSNTSASKKTSVTDSDSSNNNSVVPERTQDGWQVASLSEVGISEKLIEQLLFSIGEGNYGNIESVVIAKDGMLVHESYFNESTINNLNDTRSVSKSIVSLLIGIALDNGYLGSVEDKVLPYFNEYDLTDSWADSKENISIRHLLTMSSGLDCNDFDINSPGREGLMFDSEDWLEHFLKLPSLSEPGTHFSYCAGDVIALAGLLERATGVKGEDFASTYLFEPLGIENRLWMKSKKGLLHPNGLYINSRGMAKIGQVMLTGEWNGQTILSQEWITQALSHQIFAFDSDSLGFLWWRYTSDFSGLEYDLFIAHGRGGKSIVLIPERETVVVISASNDPRQAFSLNAQLIADFILPALN